MVLPSGDDGLWMQGRKDPNCNFNSAGNKAVLKGISRDATLYSTYLATGYGSNTTAAQYTAWNSQASSELVFADVNLCMALAD